MEIREAKRAKEAQNRQEKELDLQKFEQLQQDREEYEQYKEKLRVLVEKGYDNVEVLSAFSIEKEGKIQDTMFLFKTDDSLCLATIYIYTGDKDTYYYQVQTTLPLSALEDPNLVRDFSFDCVTTNTTVSVRFCLKKTSFPTSGLGYLQTTVSEKTVYLVLLSVQENS